MGFFGLIKSIEDLLYEIMTWLVFYPRTLWRVIRHPLAMSDYSEHEQTDTPDEQYIDTLSPPLFLMLSILIGHAIEGAAGVQTDASTTVIGKLLTGSEEMLLLFRSITFSLFPLMYALAFVKRSALELDRKTLRAPFFGQCYVGALFALAVSVGSIAVRLADGHLNLQIAAVAALVIAALAYMVSGAIWLHRHLPLTRTRAAVVSVVTFLKSLVVVLVLGAALL